MASQLKILLWKNWLLWRRGWVGALSEVLIVVLFAGLMVFVDSLVKVTRKPDTSYLRQGDVYQLSPPLPFQSIPFPGDYIAFNQAFKELAKRTIVKDCFKEDEKNGFRGGSIALIPPGNPVNLQLESFFTGIGFKVRWFNDINTLQQEVVSSNYPSSKQDALCMGLIINDYRPAEAQFHYEMIYNLTGSFDYQRDLQDTRLPEKFLLTFQKENTDLFLQYLYTGSAVFQHMIDTLLIRASKGDQSLQVNAQVVKSPVSAYSQSNLFQITSGSISTYIIFPIVLIYLRFVYFLLLEKEKRIAQNLRNMGMTTIAYYFSWILIYSLILAVISIIWTLMVGLTMFKHSNQFLIFLLFFLTGFYLLSVGFCLSSMFTRAKPGVLTALILFFVLYAGNIGIQAIAEPTEADLTAFSISPFAGLEKASSIAILLEASGFGFGFVNFFEKINSYRFCTFVFLTLGESLLFFVLGAYLDQVFPTETGVKKHPLFFLGYSRNPKSTNKVSPAQPVQINDLVEKPDPAMQLQIEENKTVTIKSLKKVYPNGKMAVDNLSLEMYSDQIFALLGHNGAGKTTTISMLSGLIDKSSGQISILGLDSQDDADKIRHVMGVCPQVNPIYDNLTVSEHLKLYAVVKSSNSTLPSQEELDKILQDIDLYDKRDYYAGKLSGGQKRKLCVAMAFVGGSKVVILDEPTSGMDTYARRHLWEMLKNYKKGRVLVLTTHYMDEADYLGDRVGIMGEGKLITCGSGLFLKDKFGAGYDLTIVKTSPEVDSNQIVQHVQWVVPSAKLVGNISMEVKLQLPVKESPQFEALFQSLDSHKAELGIQTYGVSMTTLEEVFLKVALSKAEMEELQQKNKEITTPKYDCPYELEDIRIKNDAELFRMHFNALCKKRILYFKRDYKGLVCEIILPILVVIVGLLVTLVNFFKESPPMTFTTSALPQQQHCVYNPNGNFFKNRPPSERLTFEERPFGSIYDMDTYLMNNPDNSRFYSYYVDKFNPAANDYNYTIFLNTTNPYGINIAINMMNEEVLKGATANPNARLKAGVHPFRITSFWLSFENAFDGFIAVFLISLAFSFIPAGIITFIVYERENNVKHQQIVSGVSLMAYWISNYTVDYAKYLICGIFTCLAIKIFGINAFDSAQSYGVVWLLMFLYGPAMILSTYCISFLFKSPSSAQVFTFVYNYMTGFVLMMIVYILRLVDSTRDAMFYGIEYVLRCLPAFDFSFGLFSLPNDTVWFALFKLDKVPGPWGWYGALKEIIGLIAITLISIACIYLFENFRSGVEKKPKKAEVPKKPEEIPITSRKETVNDLVTYNNLPEPVVSLAISPDNDVQAEEDLVSTSDNFAVKVYKMSKIFNIVKGSLFSKKKLVSKKVAVNSISFGVKKGECFGLLGTNGAGKTTTFKILTGELTQTSGVAKINGKDLETDIHRIIHQIGYCPQFDALLANLTSREHLELYASIKGIPEEMRPQMIKDLLLRLGLTKFEHVQAGTYSGGNKRKLSVAIALLGNPPVVFLDEPSSGMDPEARRFMWSVVAGITAGKSTTSVVLTTHSMDEAEALSNKLAIMVEGQVKCIGSVQQLKNKYGQGMEIEAKIRQPEPTEMSSVSEIVGLPADPETEIDKDTALAALSKANLQDLYDSLKQGTGECALIATQLKNKGKIKSIHLVELIYLYKRSQKIMDSLKNLFGNVTLVESFQSFFRFKIENTVQLSKVFGFFEKNVSFGLTQRRQMGVLQYSVKQTTIEQIFIGFANQRAVEE